MPTLIFLSVRFETRRHCGGVGGQSIQMRTPFREVSDHLPVVHDTVAVDGHHLGLSGDLQISHHVADTLNRYEVGEPPAYDVIVNNGKGFVVRHHVEINVFVLSSESVQRL